MIIVKIIFTLILLIGIINPALSIKIFEFWKYNRGKVSDKSYKATRIFSAIAIVIVWLLMPN